MLALLPSSPLWSVLLLLASLAALALAPWLVGIRILANDKVGIVEKLWSTSGGLSDGQLIALEGEAGFQAEVLRGGLHFGLWPWQYRLHKVPLVVVPQGTLGYVFARSGEALPPEQTLARSVPCAQFQDTAAFLAAGGQRGRQREVLREGVYAVHSGQFVVLTEDTAYHLAKDVELGAQAKAWRRELLAIDGFRPVLVGAQPGEAGDDVAVVTTQDGPCLSSGEVIAPPIGGPDGLAAHDSFQDVEAFLALGGRRGRQLPLLTDGTYWLNRWFATVERLPKTVVPIGHVGVVVSYFGQPGDDVSGELFRHGERVAEGRGVLAEPLGPGKYAFNTYAGRVHVVPTTNFVLHWITGRTESHRFDESLKSIDLVTADAYEPTLPLSVVVHIDYAKAPSVVQRFGDVKQLITQTLDPLLSAYFRDIAHKKAMLELLHQRDEIQREARAELEARFARFDIELVDVLIGKPDLAEGDDQIETLLQQLRSRQLAREQVVTYAEQQVAAEKQRTLEEALTRARKQADLTNAELSVRISEDEGRAALARARQAAEQTVVTAKAEQERVVLLAESEGRSRVLLGEGEARRIRLEGEAAAEVARQRVAAYGDPRLLALTDAARRLARSRQPLVPERLFVTGAGGGNGEGGERGLLGMLLALLTAERGGLALREDGATGEEEA